MQKFVLDVLTGACEPACFERRRAMRFGEFVWSEYRHGWVVPPWAHNAPVGALDAVFSDCPWCGHELPKFTYGADDGN